MTEFFKAVLESDSAEVVICNTQHIIIYMNPAAKNKYHSNLVGKSLLGCHNV